MNPNVGAQSWKYTNQNLILIRTKPNRAKFQIILLVEVDFDELRTL